MSSWSHVHTQPEHFSEEPVAYDHVLEIQAAALGSCLKVIGRQTLSLSLQAHVESTHSHSTNSAHLPCFLSKGLRVSCQLPQKSCVNPPTSALLASQAWAPTPSLSTRLPKTNTAYTVKKTGFNPTLLKWLACKLMTTFPFTKTLKWKHCSTLHTYKILIQMTMK